jgi:glycerol-3-phosphate dehydrogenase
MTAKQSRRFLKPLCYAIGTVAGGVAVLYISYRPRNIPGLSPAAVPPPTYNEGGKLVPPSFPHIKSRDEQIQNLKRSSGITESQRVQSSWRRYIFGAKGPKDRAVKESEEEEPYDLLVIGAGATGSGIALDAATRGLKVALVERDDFSSGTSSKSTKLVHGGVRYLEKAVWELDYNQYANWSPP